MPPTGWTTKARSEVAAQGAWIVIVPLRLHGGARHGLLPSPAFAGRRPSAASPTRSLTRCCPAGASTGIRFMERYPQVAVQLRQHLHLSPARRCPSRFEDRPPRGERNCLMGGAGLAPPGDCARMADDCRRGMWAAPANIYSWVDRRRTHWHWQQLLSSSRREFDLGASSSLVNFPETVLRSSSSASTASRQDRSLPMPGPSIFAHYLAATEVDPVAPTVSDLQGIAARAAARCAGTRRSGSKLSRRRRRPLEAVRLVNGRRPPQPKTRAAPPSPTATRA